MKTLRILSFTTATFAYVVIVLGFVVRITGSGMGCGDDWPLCNGRIIPPLDDLQTVLEYFHRLSVLGLTVLALAVVGYAFTNRAAPGGSGRGGTLRPAVLAVVLLVVQSLLGAVTVWLELPPSTVVLHLGTGMALVAALMVLGLRAGVHGGLTEPPASAGDTTARGRILGAAALGTAVILLGGVTATTGAAPACQGFPLCSGQLWPSATASGLPHIHWTHRLLAYALFFHLLGLAIGLQRKSVPARLGEVAWVAFGLGVAQVAVGAIMVLSHLPPVWRALHAALGTALWVGLVWLTWLVTASIGGAPRSASAASG